MTRKALIVVATTESQIRWAGHVAQFAASGGHLMSPSGTGWKENDYSAGIRKANRNDSSRLETNASRYETGVLGVLLLYLSGIESSRLKT